MDSPNSVTPSEKGMSSSPSVQEPVLDDDHGLQRTISTNPSLSRTDTNPNGSRPACFRNTVQEILFVLTTTFAIGQSSIFAGALVCLTSFIGRDLHMNAAEISWINAAQYLTAGSFLLFFGRVADVFGRRLLLLISLGGFAICLLILGFSKSAIFLNSFCGVAGLCCAAAVPPAIGKLGAVYAQPSRRKNYAFACFSAGNPVGFAIGGFVSGVAMAVTNSNWRASFWTMSVIYAFFTLIAYFTVPADTEQTLEPFTLATLKKFDFLGSLLAVTGTAAFTAGLTLPGQAPNGWRQNYVLVLITLGIALIATFIYWQSIFSFPIMPLGIWRQRDFSLLVAMLCLGFYGFSGNIFWLTLSWQRLENSSALAVAVRLLPAMIGGIIINVIAGLVMHRVSNKLLMTIGAIGNVIACALLSGMNSYHRGHTLSGEEYGNMYWSFALPALLASVIGADFTFTVVNMYVMSSLPTAQQSVAGGMFNTVTRLVSSVGLGIQTGVFASLGGAGGGTGEGSGKGGYRAYQATYWVSLGGAVVALGLLPFLRIGTQGGKTRVEKTRNDSKTTKTLVREKERPDEKTGVGREDGRMTGGQDVKI